MSEHDHLTIIRQNLPIEFVSLDHNPTTYKVGRAAVNSNRGRSGGGGDSGSGGAAGHTNSVFHGNDPMTVTLNGGRLEGEMTKLRVDTMLSWLSPASGLIGAALSAIGSALDFTVNEPPNLIVQWGPPAAGLLLTARMTKCEVTYERVDSSGIPLRAMVNLTFKEQPSILSHIPTNPTSGGRPGRRKHVAEEGDTLVSIANSTYGSPSAWRPLAQMNGLDAPDRLRPGQVVYLPSPAELQEATQ